MGFETGDSSSFSDWSDFELKAPSGGSLETVPWWKPLVCTHHILPFQFFVSWNPFSDAQKHLGAVEIALYCHQRLGGEFLKDEEMKILLLLEMLISKHSRYHNDLLYRVFHQYNYFKNSNLQKFWVVKLIWHNQLLSRCPPRGRTAVN